MSFPNPKHAFNCERLHVTTRLQQHSEGHVESDHRSARAQLYAEALQLLLSAIDMLDRASAPGHIAAHVDLAVHQLQDVIDAESAGGRVVQSQSKTAPK